MPEIIRPQDAVIPIEIAHPFLSTQIFLGPGGTPTRGQSAAAWGGTCCKEARCSTSIPRARPHWAGLLLGHRAGAQDHKNPSPSRLLRGRGYWLWAAGTQDTGSSASATRATTGTICRARVTQESIFYGTGGPSSVSGWVLHTMGQLHYLARGQSLMKLLLTRAI